MKTSSSHPKKSPASKARRKVGTARGAVRARKAGAIPAAVPPGTSQRDVPTNLRREFRAWRASLPTALERDTLLMPEAIAESVVPEAERFLNARLPADYAERLAVKAHRLYPHHQHFKKMLNRPGNAGRNHLYMYMRHWTAGWLKRERSALYKKLPKSYAQGRALTATAPGVPRNYPDARKLVTEDCIRP